MPNANVSRYSTYGAIRRLHRGKPYRDLVSSKEWKFFITTRLNNAQYQVAIIPNTMEFRADLIADAAYGNQKYWWLVCVANGILDPTTELTAGKQILLPII